MGGRTFLSEEVAYGKGDKIPQPTCPRFARISLTPPHSVPHTVVKMTILRRGKDYELRRIEESYYAEIALNRTTTRVALQLNRGEML